MDTVTERIEQAISDRRMFKRTVMHLAGIGETTWLRRARSGDWTTSEVARIASVLRVRFETLAGA